MTRILLVEDNEMNRDMLSRRLKKKGFEVVMALDGKQGVEMAGDIAPDLILLDMSLPVMDGWETARHLNSPVMKSEFTQFACGATMITSIAVSPCISAMMAMARSTSD